LAENADGQPINSNGLTIQTSATTATTKDIWVASDCNNGIILSPVNFGILYFAAFDDSSRKV
jgi:hypothetical protein